jgi:hypothetical protein
MVANLGIQNLSPDGVNNLTRGTVYNPNADSVVKWITIKDVGQVQFCSRCKICSSHQIHFPAMLVPPVSGTSSVGPRMNASYMAFWLFGKYA